MSIPVSIDPLGTLGASRKPSGYVEAGLVYWLDVLADGTGTRSELTELVSAEKVPCQATDYDPPIAGNDGVLRGYVYIPFGNFVAGPGYSVELVACSTDKRATIGVFADKGSQHPDVTGRVKCVGLQNTLNVFNWKGFTGTLDFQTNFFAIPAERIGKISTFAWASSTATPKCDSVLLVRGGDGGASTVSLFKWETARFCALRVYNRVLSASEGAQNSARDAERWNKGIVVA